ncbi:hypothetical protein HXP44_04770 [Streptomyces sioyaensis]|uniref:hypothetical protein n=1 Tax=Streptomyces sioyaensis TaxID=67364 RepID=UPI0012ABCDF2|nr:hypothetical protein [Streptomyces sioyaensis]MBM4791395.1 hypothetical protein [Streptomyces sioyaensis]
MSTRAAHPLRRPHAPRAPRPPRRRALPAGGPAGPAAADQITTPAAIPGGIR